MVDITTDAEALIGTSEAAQLLGLSRTHVNRLARAGDLQVAQRISPQSLRPTNLFRIEDVKQYAADHLPERPVHRLVAS